MAEIKRVNRLSILVKWLEGEDKDLETLITEQNYNTVERAWQGGGGGEKTTSTNAYNR